MAYKMSEHDRFRRNQIFWLAANGHPVGLAMAQCGEKRRKHRERVRRYYYRQDTHSTFHGHIDDF